MTAAVCFDLRGLVGAPIPGCTLPAAEPESRSPAPTRAVVQQTLSRLAQLADQAADEWAETGSDQACEALARCEELISRLLETA